MSESILGTSKVIAFAPVTNMEKAREFYEGALGLHLVADEKPFALVFDANGTMLRVTPVGKTVVPAGYTVLGWAVSDIEATVAELSANGVVFERFPGLGQANWGEIVHALLRAGYDSDLNIEGWHDPVFRNHEAGPKLEDAGLIIAKQSLERYVANTEKN